MYSVVLAAVLTTGSATPDWHFGSCYGCHGCYGCYGCYGCCGGCYGCYGFGGCWGCYGCYGFGGCWGCYGCYGGAYAYTPYNFYSCNGCTGSWSCYGCSGTTLIGPATIHVVPKEKEKPKLPKPKPEGSGPRPANVYVKADPGTRITVNDEPIAMTGVAETFATPDLEPGKKYSYVFKAESLRDGKAVATKKVYVTAGEETWVDLRMQTAATDAAAKVTVVLPEDARLYIDDVPYPVVQEKITFDTPRLEAERTYYYTLKAEAVRNGKVYRDSRRVDVIAGREVRVEFKELPNVHALQR